MLAGLGQFCKELVEGSIPSTTTWSRAFAWFKWTVLEQQESCSLPNYSSGRLPDFFLTLCALLPRFCLWSTSLATTLLPKPVLPSIIFARCVLRHHVFPRSLHSIVQSCILLCALVLPDISANLFRAVCHPVFCKFGISALRRSCLTSCSKLIFALRHFTRPLCIYIAFALLQLFLALVHIRTSA